MGHHPAHRLPSCLQIQCSLWGVAPCTKASYETRYRRPTGLILCDFNQRLIWAYALLPFNHAIHHPRSHKRQSHNLHTWQPAKRQITKRLCNTALHRPITLNHTWTYRKCIKVPTATTSNKSCCVPFFPLQSSSRLGRKPTQLNTIHQQTRWIVWID